MAHQVRTIMLPMPLGMGTVNCYLIETPAGHLLVDTGSSSARRRLHAALESSGCTPASLRLVLLTHGDFDHTGNTAWLRSVYGARVAMHEEDTGMAERGDMFANRRKPVLLLRVLLPLFSGFGRREHFKPDLLLRDGDPLDDFGLEARVLSLPGHSRGSVGILTAAGELFCGDLFENTRGPRLSSLMDDPEAAGRSLETLARQKVTTVYPGHGQPFSQAQLLEVLPPTA